MFGGLLSGLLGGGLRGFLGGGRRGGFGGGMLGAVTGGLGMRSRRRRSLLTKTRMVELQWVSQNIGKTAAANMLTLYRR